jgi:2-polyprenyl-3-methyl-5-hydroxy-6-metoxy-1,4-benzoquinol methylase
MDQPGVPEHEIRQALRELETVNTFLGGYNVVLDALGKIKWPNREVTIMDLGCGGGDMLRAIAKWAEKKNRKVRLIGIDWNPVMTQYAAEHSTAYKNIQFKTLSIFDDALLKESADITMCSLFCHHFDREELITLIRRMYILAGKAVIINDLHRHWFAYHSIKVLTAVFSKTYLVKYDAALSVARSFRKNELQEILKAAGINKYSLKWRWAWRWELIIEK